MALILVSELIVGTGSGSTEPVSYNNNEVTFVGNQATAVGVQTVNVIVKNAIATKAGANTPSTVIMAVNRNKALLDNDYHYAVLPCPPYCSK